MDCNKDEAIRAKEMAEKKMQNNDFEGARRIALKAQQLFPKLDDINQLLTSCNVHCAAQNKLFGSEKDFYAILQLDKFADEVAIKKQITKLALTLHPDNNKLPGAAAAFKLVGEARELLLDTGKKTVYDSKCKVSVSTAQPSPYQCGSLHRSQATSKPSVPQETFWTACYHCKTMFMYLKKHLNRAMLCAHCRKAFTAYELSDKKVPRTSSMGKPQPKSVPTGKASTTVKSEFGEEGNDADGGKVKSGNNNDANLNSAAGGTHDGVHANKKKRESGVEENGRKRERKNVEGSSESRDTSRQ